MRASDGEGVDIVINSLAADFIPESLRLLRRGGRFIEIGKTGIWDAARVAMEFPGVEYFPFYLGELAAGRSPYLREMLRSLLDDFDAGTLSPLPHRSYAIERAEEAFRYMGQGQHTGKIVITQHPAPRPRPDASYLITGGLGSLGLVCARWLADAGARHIVLLGRRAPTPEAEGVIAELRAKGVEATVAQADVADAAQLDQVIGRIAPPLRGVIHAAGVVDDAMIQQLSVPRFRAVMAPKVRGTWNLHTSTAQQSARFLCDVFLGCVAAGLAWAGQLRRGQRIHGCARTPSARARRSRLEHQLGQLGRSGNGGGVDESYRRRWASMGLAMIEPEDGVRMLQDLVYANRASQVAAVPLVRARLPQSLPPFFTELTVHRSAAGQGAGSVPVSQTADGTGQSRWRAGGGRTCRPALRIPR